MFTYAYEYEPRATPVPNTGQLYISMHIWVYLSTDTDTSRYLGSRLGTCGHSGSRLRAERRRPDSA